MRRLGIVIALLVLIGCGGPSAVTSQQVAEKLTALGATNVHAEAFGAEVKAPRSFQERQVFVIPSLGGGKGGQFFICDTKTNCDAIFAYYSALKDLAGPYLYQSPNGTVVLQLNNELPPTEATKYETAIKSLP